jgi:hypothetical protein
VVGLDFLPRLLRPEVGLLHKIDKRGRFLLLAALTIIAAWLRFSGAGFGLPDQFRPDEQNIIPTALDFETDWNPHLAIYPAAQTYLIHGVLRAYAILTGSGRDLRQAYATDNGAQAFLIGRRISAAMGAATVPAIYLAGAPVLGPGAALVSAAMLTVSYIHVRESKFAKVEVPAGFWLALGLLMTMRISCRRRLTDYTLAGFFCGLAAATHYTAGAISIGILAAHLEGRYRETKSYIAALIDPGIYLAGLAAILTFLFADPYFVLDWKQTEHDYFLLRNNFTAWPGDNAHASFGWRWLFLRAMPAGLGVEFEIFLLAAMIWTVFRPKPGTFALLSFTVACFLSLVSGRPQLEFRYLVNPLLSMVLLGGAFATDLEGVARQWLGDRIGLLVALAAGVFLITPSFIRDVQLNWLLHRTDTRTVASEWIADHIPPRSTVALIGAHRWGKPKMPDKYLLITVRSPRGLQHAIRIAKWVVWDSFPSLALWSPAPTDEELDQMKSRGTLEFDLDPLKAGAETAAFDPNDAFYVPFNHISSMSRPGPRIRIWKIKAVDSTDIDFPTPGMASPR